MIRRAIALVNRLLGRDPRIAGGGRLDLDLNFIKEFDWGHGATIEDYLLLTGIVANLKPRTILEIGTSHGLGSLVMAHAASTVGVDARITTVDMDQSGGRKNLAAVPAAERVIEFIESRSDDALARFASEGRRFDLVFIDGAHDYAQARRDWEGARALSGLWIFHDSTQFEGVQRLIREIRAMPEYETFQVCSAPGHLRYLTSNLLGTQGAPGLARIITGLTIVQSRAGLADLPRWAHYDEQAKLLPGHQPSIHPEL